MWPIQSGGKRLLVVWDIFGLNLKSIPFVFQSRRITFFVIHRPACKIQIERWPIWNFADLHLLLRCTTDENFNAIRLVEVEIWKLPIVWLIFVSERWWRQQWRHQGMTNCFWKGVSVHLAHTCVVLLENFQSIRSYKNIFTRGGGLSTHPTFLTG